MCLVVFTGAALFAVQPDVGSGSGPAVHVHPVARSTSTERAWTVVWHTLDNAGLFIARWAAELYRNEPSETVRDRMITAVAGLRYQYRGPQPVVLLARMYQAEPDGTLRTRIQQTLGTNTHAGVMHLIESGDPDYQYYQGQLQRFQQGTPDPDRETSDR